MAAAQLDVLVDSSVLTVGSASSICALDSRLVSTHKISTSVPADVGSPPGTTRVRIIIYDNEDPVDSFTDGIIATCAFAVTSSAVPGMYPVTGELPTTSGEYGDPFSAAYGNGAVVVCGGCGC